MIETTHDDFLPGKARCPHCKEPLLPEKVSEPLTMRSMRVDDDDPMDDYDIPFIARDECPACGEMFEIRFTFEPPEKE